MDRVPNMGMRRDLSQRASLARVDDVNRRSRLDTARKAIYEKNNTVDGAVVENLLKNDSLVPAAVSVFLSRRHFMHTCSRTHSPISYRRLGLTCFPCWL